MDTVLNVPSEEHKDDDDNPPPPSTGCSRIVLGVSGDESEDEDVDFNPLLKESPSGEPSSSISSEAERLDGDVESCGGGALLGSEGVDDHLVRIIGEGEGEEVGVSYAFEKEIGRGRERKGGLDSGNDVVEAGGVEEQVAATCGLNYGSTFGSDDEDAICKRTRARYSLAKFTLDELESFLQESDDDDDFPNVDEQGEYRKFLTAVLKGGDADGEGAVEGNADGDDDDDEDNDADFEIEIEEALESDVDDCVITSNNSEKFEKSPRRPKTRQNSRQKVNALDKRKGKHQGDRPLRALLPLMPSAPATSILYLGGSFVTNPVCSQNFKPLGFVDHQIGQLHCLIYEHVQLLVQVYSLCALEQSLQQIASQVKGFLLELLHKRDFALAWKTEAYPTSCFLPQYINSFVSVETPKVLRVGASSDTSDDQGCGWLPSVSGTVLSVLDVEPLRLVNNYIIDVSNALRVHQRQCVETSNIYLEKQPLFPHPVCPPEATSNVSNGENPSSYVSAVSPNDKVPKKTLAAMLVESTKNSIALVPRQIAKLAEPFYPLFNSALFPHKPPLPSVANRVLFTDAEDVLVAMGILEFNNDWKAIQHRFLPCKTEHQIFVRAKNRCCSNAPDNPIKTVRKLKTSPLTKDEKARIEEGLKTFKLDWTSIWRAIVPYRDPNLLPRQWRTAIGTQKSYKAASAKKEKHRIYESNRRRKVEAIGNSHSQIGLGKKGNQALYYGHQNDNREVRVDRGPEAYVHEAFLADWRPSSAGLNACSTPGVASTGGHCELQELPGKHRSIESQSEKDSATCKVSGSPLNSHLKNFESFQTHPATGSPSPYVSVSKSFGCGSPLNSQRAHKRSTFSLVKLSPELPPVKLPPAVRVISQASLKSSQHAGSTEVGVYGHLCGNTARGPIAVGSSSNSEEPLPEKTRVSTSNHVSMSSPNTAVPEERGTEVDLQMHPLLFRAHGEGNLPCYSVNGSSSTPFSFFPAVQQQMNVNFLQNSHSGPVDVSKSFGLQEFASASTCSDFHPFLQRKADFNSNSIPLDSTPSRLSTELELSRDGFVEETVYRPGADASLPNVSEPICPTSDTNDLDLDINLSSASKKRKLSTVEGIESNSVMVPVSVENIHRDQRLSPLACYHLADSVAAASTAKSASCNSTVQLQNVEDSPCTSINGHDDQLPLEIVMEQEELSDSEEEMEDVEFECEEMTDSDGEECSEATQIVNSKYKEQENITPPAVEKVGLLEPGTYFGGSRIQRKGRQPKSDFMRLGKGTKDSWLSLNSNGSHILLQSRIACTQTSAGTLLTSVSNKSSKKAALNGKKSLPDKRSTDLPGLDLAPTSSRKPRKQVVRRPIRRADVPVANLNCTEKDGKDDTEQ